jgi:2-polyprenyl-3-methyl-5-hydroxy-6-metoxy-1,4-benzoquinol methylase
MTNFLKCPICNSSTVNKLFTLNSLEASNLIVPDNPAVSDKLVFLIEQLWQQNYSTFYTCKICDYCFSLPYVPGNEEIYSTLYYKEFNYPDNKWEYSRTIEILKNLGLKSDSHLLEIGAGNGAFLQKASKIFTNKKSIFSTEYSLSGIETIQANGFNCISSDISNLPEKNLPKFDVIFMFQVLEHMNNLNVVFETINKLCTPTAQLFIAVPNGFLRSFYDKMGLHYDVPPIHIGRFTQKTFNFIAKKHNWIVRDCIIEPRSFSFKLKKFIFDRFARNKIAKKSEKSKIALIKYLFRYSIMLLLIIRHMRIVFKLISSKTGTSLLVHMERL